MITTKENIIPLTSTFKDKSVQRAAHLAGSLAENLEDGDYVLSTHPLPVFFIRVDEWDRDMVIESVDIDTEFQIKLSNGRIIPLFKKQVQNAFDHVDHFRVVLLSSKGFTSFKINL